MRNRTLMRPMFRMGGSSGTGITSGLDRPGYQIGGGAGMARENIRLSDLPFMKSPQVDTSKITSNIDKKPTGLGLGTIPGFLTQFGLNLASATPRGNIFATAAEAAKEPFGTFQQAKFAEAQEEREFEREKQLQLLKNLDADSRSAIMKQAEEGFEAGKYSSVNEGVIRLLDTKEFGIAKRPGERRQQRIDDLTKIAMGEAGRSQNEEPIVRNEVTVRQDYKTLEENNPNIDFAPPSLIALDFDEDDKGGYKITSTNLTPGKVYYSGFTDEFFLFNGPGTEQPFTKIDVKR